MGNFMSCVLICGAMEVVQVVNTNGRVEKLIRPIRAAELIWAHERYKAALAAGLNPSTAFDKTSAPPPENPSKKKMSPSPTSKPAASEDPTNASGKFVLLPLDPSKPVSNSSVAEVGCRAYNFQCLSQENVSVKHVKKSRSSSTGSSKQDSHSHSQQPLVNHGNTNGHHHHPAPFRVKKEGGVTTLVVSKRYLEQLLTEKEMKTAKEAEKAAAVTATDILQEHNYLPTLHSSSRHSSRRSRSSGNTGSRVSIWRPALESISESQNNHNNPGALSTTSGHHQQKQHHIHQHHHHQQQQQRQQ